jgi:hypothetical protein
MLHRLAVIIALVFGLTFLATTSAAAQASSQCNVPITGATGLVQQGEQQVVQMICKVHTQIYVMVAKLKKIGDTKAGGNETRSYTVSYAVKIIAWIALLVFSYAMIVVAMQVFEVIVRLAIYTALAPFIIYCAVYPNTRHIFDNAIKGYIYATIKFTLLGAFLAAGLMIAKLCTDAVGSLANTIDGMSTAVSSESVAQAISYAGIAFVTGMMIGRIMTAASTAAAELSAYAYANLGVAAGGMTSLATFTRTVIATAMVGALAAPAVLRGGIAAFRGTNNLLKNTPLSKIPGAAGVANVGMWIGGAGLIKQALKPTPPDSPISSPASSNGDQASPPSPH